MMTKGGRGGKPKVDEVDGRGGGSGNPNMSDII